VARLGAHLGADIRKRAIRFELESDSFKFLKIFCCQNVAVASQNQRINAIRKRHYNSFGRRGYYERYMLSKNAIQPEQVNSSGEQPFLDSYVLEFLDLPNEDVH
jgi:hypothetical protein